MGVQNQAKDIDINHELLAHSRGEGDRHRLLSLIVHDICWPNDSHDVFVTCDGCNGVLGFVAGYTECMKAVAGVDWRDG